MGQILQVDKIGVLSHSAGSITLAPSILTIGGQQFTTSTLTRAITTDVTITQNQRYQIYAVQTGGVVSLKFSANENSAGPSGYTSWKLVGSFYANGISTPAFGSFVNIDSTPETEWMAFEGIVVASSNPTKGTISSEKFSWRRIGDSIQIFWDTVYTSAGSAGSGNYSYTLPSSLTVNTSKFGTSGNWVNMHCGTFSINSSGVPTTLIGYIVINGIASLGATSYHGNILSSGYGAYSDSAHNLSFKAELPISGFTITPIKDL